MRKKAAKPAAVKYEKGKHPGGAKRRWEVTPQILEEIRLLSGRGLTNEQLFGYYGISSACWYENIKRFPDVGVAIRQGKAKTLSFVSGKLLELVKLGNISAIIFYLKTQGGWREQNNSSPVDDKQQAPALSLTVNDPVEAAKIYAKIMTGS